MERKGENINRKIECLCGIETVRENGIKGKAHETEGEIYQHLDC